MNPRDVIERYATIGLVAGGTTAVIQAVRADTSVILGLVLGAVGGLAGGAAYGYLKLRLASRRR